MAKAPDDLDAVRALVQTLEAFAPEEQERIMRWAREKLGLQPIPPEAAPAAAARPTTTKRRDAEPTGARKAADIKTFVADKNPKSDRQFAATVAYFYMFEAPEAERKESITSDDLQEACRKAGRRRPKNPGQTLINAHHAGLLDKTAERGRYAINTVGENLVAMALPEGPAPTTKKSPAGKAKKRAKKKPSRKKSTKGK